MATTRAFETGSARLLGDNLVRRLLERGFAVRALSMNTAAFVAVLQDVDVQNHCLSKMRSDAAVFAVLARHSDLYVSIVLTEWMFGPRDAGPTAAGQTMLDFMHRKLPGIVSGSFSVVDARDVARAMIAAAAHGRRRERYLAAGRRMTPCSS